MGQNRNGYHGRNRFDHNRVSTSYVAAAVLLLFMASDSKLWAFDPPKSSLSDLQALASWPWSNRLSWRDDPAGLHGSWHLGCSMALQSMRAGYQTLTIDEGAGETQSSQSPVQILGWVAATGPVTKSISAAMGWYRTNLGLVRFENQGLAQRFLFNSASWIRDDVTWNLAAEVTGRLSVGFGLGFERIAVAQNMTLWPGDSRSRPAADGTFDLPIRLSLSGYRATIGLGFSWRGPKWLKVVASAGLLTPIHMTGRFFLSARAPSLQVTAQANEGQVRLERGLLLRSALQLAVDLPHFVIALGADVQGPGYRKAMIRLDDLVVTGPQGPGSITSLPPAWTPRSLAWSVHGTIGARLDRRGLRLVGGGSATSSNTSFCGRLPQTPDYRAGLALVVRLGPAMVAASYGRRWAKTHCEHAFPAAFNPSAGPTRKATERRRFLDTDLAAFTILLPLP